MRISIDVISKRLEFILREESIEFEDVHTHMLEFKKKDDSLIKYWVENLDKERQWTSWDRCNTIKICSKNNTMLVLAPQSNPPTLHGVKLNYDHKKFQRTQIYGNLIFLCKLLRAFTYLLYQMYRNVLNISM